MYSLRNSRFSIVLLCTVLIQITFNTEFIGASPLPTPVAEQDENAADIFPRILGGVPADEFVVKRLAHILITLEHEFLNFTRTDVCSATVIHKNWLLTAAHCFARESFLGTANGTTHAFVGESSATLRIGNTDIKPFFAKTLFIHKNYIPSSVDQRNDIALVQLNESIPSNVGVPVSISRSSNMEHLLGKNISAAGYGVIDNSKTPADMLMETTLLVKDFDTCISRTPSAIGQLLETERAVCAVSPGFPEIGTSDTCFGDSGGPLFTHSTRSNFFLQVGITSFGSTIRCAEPGSVAWYTRVSFYYQAIKQAINGNFQEWRQL